MDIKKKKMIKKSIYITTLLLLIVFISSIGFEIYKIYDDNKITISDCIKAGNKKFDSIDVKYCRLIGVSFLDGLWRNRGNETG